MTETVEQQRTYTYEEALELAKEYFDGSELEASTFLNKYALKDNDDNILEATPDQMHRRLAKELARIEQKYPDPLTEEEIYNYLKGFGKIIPQGSPMAGIGNPYQLLSLGNCFVVGSDKADSYGGIMYVDEALTQLMKRRGGVGTDISHLRPAGTSVKNASNSSTGATSFMHRYSNTTREVAQCLEENQDVLTKSGLKKIKNVKIGDFVWTKKGWVDVIDKFSNEKEVYEIQTKFGYKIQASKDHKFSILDGDIIKEENLENLSKGSTINILIGSDEISTDYVYFNDYEYKKSKINNSNRLNENVDIPKKLDEKLAYVLGYLYGDGYVCKHPKNGDNCGISASFNIDQENIGNKYAKYLIDIFGIAPKRKNNNGNWYNLRIYSRILVDFLEKNNLLKQKTENIEFPNKIKKSPISVKSSFLSGYFDADGYASGSKKGYVFSSIQEEFLYDVQKTLLSMGVVSKKYKEDRKHLKQSDLFTICIVGSEAQRKFVELMGESEKIQNCDHISKRDCILTSYKPKTHNIKYNNYSYVGDNTQFMSTSAYNKVLNKEEKTLPNSLIQDEVISIKTVGNRKTYDLSLSEEHLFWCEGFYVHNSGRRGALMLTLDSRHPDIEEFITIKNNETSVTGANISIRFRDDFMNAIKNGHTEYTLKYPIDSDNPEIEKVINPQELWDEFINNTYNWAEPSGLFWDRILEESIPSHYEGFKETSTNPCGELPLTPWDSCRLLIVNLFNHVKNPFTDDAYFDYEEFKDSVEVAQRLMDDIVDLELEQIDKILNKIDNDPEPEYVKRHEKEIWEKIKEKCKKGRRTGTGITAVGDMIAGMGLTYGTDRGTEFADEVMNTFKLSAFRSSVNMAKERGAFSIWEHQREKDNPFLNRIKEEDPELYGDMKIHGRRNISLLTIAPCGTTSMMAQTTSGIENLFAPYYFRKKKINPNDEGVRTDFVDSSGDHWMEFPVFHKRFEQYLEVNGYNMDKVKKMDSEEIDELVKESPYYNATTKDVDWVKKVEMQGKIQKHIDHSISVTTNLPEDASKETVERVYMKAWESGCKGCTIYREGTRSDVLSTKSTKEKEEGGFRDHHAPKRPKRLECDVHHFINNGEKWLAFIGMLDGRPYEVFAGKESAFDIPTTSVTGEIVKEKNNGNSRYDYHYTHYNKPKVAKGLSNVFDREYWNYAKFVSMTLRHGAPIQYVVDVLTGLEFEQDHISTWKRGLARILKKYIPEDVVIKNKPINPECPDKSKCNIVREEGCSKCLECGYSGCG